MQEKHTDETAREKRKEKDHTLTKKNKSPLSSFPCL